MMDAGRKWGTLGALLGIAFGGLTWLIVLGVAVQSVTYTLIPGLITVVAIGGGWTILRHYPHRIGWALGFAVVVVAITGLVLGNILFDQIPDQFMGQPTNKDSLGRFGMNLMLALTFLIGLVLLAWGTVSGRSNRLTANR